MNWLQWTDDLIDSQVVVRYLIYKRMFTPYEMDQKFSDESLYTDNEYSFGILRQAIQLPDDDLLLKFEDVYADEGDVDLTGIYEYHKLSEIELAEFGCDNKEAEE